MLIHLTVFTFDHKYLAIYNIYFFLKNTVMIIMTCVDNILIVAPWGMPIWRRLTYSINGKEIKSCTSLLPLLLSMKEYIDAGKVDIVIIVLDSLVDKYEGSVDRESECVKCYYELQDYINKANEADLYKDLVSALESFTKEFFKCLLRKYNLDLKINDLNVIVAPAIGSPGGKWTFKGELREFSSLLLHKIAKMGLLKPYHKIIVDLTHGINFMPSLVTNLLHKFASIILLAHKDLDKIVIEVYNSDPVVPTRDEIKRLININKAFHEEIKTIQLIHAIPYFIRVSEWIKDNMYKRDLFMKIKDLENRITSVLFGHIKYVYSSLYYPLPLALYYLICGQDLYDLGQVIENEYINYIYINKKDLTIERPYTIEPDALYVYYISKAVHNRLNLTKCVPPDLDYLETVFTQIYSRVNIAYEALIEHEISQLRQLEEKIKEDKDILNRLLNRWESYDKIKLLSERKDVKSEEEKEKSQKMPDKRILIAHVGLSYDLVELSLNEQNKLVLRYKLEPKKILEDSKLIVKSEK